ncbi:hypothetical protein PVAP13_6KG186812 [Panicum virgatum]|uniref:Uncharacterized protein n=1 Tax=Panicum virgatum TaxID=38727 RepID=A0A8T0R9Y6_PANVG|nr:hypothetical protein PVAP13_6KG186812 [Panicum virgatum]
MIQAVIPHMMETRESTTANVESITALAPGSWPGVYSTSKAALHALSDSQRCLFHHHNNKGLNRGGMFTGI